MAALTRPGIAREASATSTAESTPPESAISSEGRGCEAPLSARHLLGQGHGVRIHRSTKGAENPDAEPPKPRPGAHKARPDLSLVWSFRTPS